LYRVKSLLKLMLCNTFVELFADGNDFSSAAIDRARNRHMQRQSADAINQQTKEITSLLTRALTIHLNIGQQFTTNVSSVYMSSETVSIGSLSNKEIQTVGDARIQLPSILDSSLTENLTGVLRVRRHRCLIRRYVSNDVILRSILSSQHWNRWRTLATRKYH
jgi:peptidoglycan biosynthesis protein MviN/MurJ (putative lipid II flippase)